MGLRSSVNIWVGTGAAALASLAILAALDRPRLRSKRATSATKSLVLGLGVGVLMGAGTWLLYPFAAEAVPEVSREVQRLYALLREPPGPLWAFPVLVLVVSAEELIWRGLAIDVFAERFGVRAAVVASAALYVLPQIAFRSPLLMLTALLCGLIWGILRAFTSGLLAPWAAHLVWDLLVFVVAPVE